MRGMFVELVVFALLDLVLGAGPQRGRSVDGFQLPVVAGIGHLDGNRDVVGVAAHDVSEPVAFEELVLALAQTEDHLGAARGDGYAFDGVLPVPNGLPAHAAFHRHPGSPGVHRHLVRDDEARVEPHSELSDELSILVPVSREGVEELPGPGLGNGAQVLDDLLIAHADAVVAYADASSVLVVFDLDVQIAVSLVEVDSLDNASKRSLSAASEAFEISSRRKISLLL